MSKEKINATRYEDIPAFPRKPKSEDVIINAVIETPKRSCHKYALKADYGIIAFHEVLPEEMEWPYDYGFIPQTLAPDGDPMDVLVLTKHGLFAGCFIQTRLLGCIRETKDGTKNDRFLAAPQPSPGAPQPTDAYHTIADLPREELNKIVNFLISYSSNQGHDIIVTDIVDAKDALNLIKQGTKAFTKGKK